MKIGTQPIPTGVDHTSVAATVPGRDDQQRTLIGENPSRLSHDRQIEFSNARCCRQLGQVKSRIRHSLFE